MSDELWDRAIDEARNRWVARTLGDAGRHCAVGILGYVKWGQQWDDEVTAWLAGERRASPNVNPYFKVEHDSELGPMAAQLAEAIQEQHHDHMFPSGRRFTDIVVEYNDNLAATGENLAAMMEKARVR